MNQSELSSARPFIHIKPRKGWQLIDFSELKGYRDLLYFLVLRDIKVKYKQTVLGGLWAVIQPFFSMVVFRFFLGGASEDAFGRRPVSYLQLQHSGGMDLLWPFTQRLRHKPQRARVFSLQVFCTSNKWNGIS
jgi:hypothetical protein